MNNTWRIRLAKKRLTESVKGVNTIIIANAILFFVLLLFGGELFVED